MSSLNTRSVILFGSSKQNITQKKGVIVMNGFQLWVISQSKRTSFMQPIFYNSPDGNNLGNLYILHSIFWVQKSHAESENKLWTQAAEKEGKPRIYIDWIKRAWYPLKQKQKFPCILILSGYSNCHSETNHSWTLRVTQKCILIIILY